MTVRFLKYSTFFLTAECCFRGTRIFEEKKFAMFPFVVVVKQIFSWNQFFFLKNLNLQIQLLTIRLTVSRRLVIIMNLEPETI